MTATRTPVDPAAGGPAPVPVPAPDAAALAAVLADLRAALPAEALVTHPDTLRGRAQDGSATPPTGDPVALVQPSTTAEVSAVLRAAHAHRVPVVPQGALSGLAGGANAVPGAILLSTARMTRIRRIDPVDQVAVVQPGVVTKDLVDAVAARGLFYPPDPASYAQSTIGGNIATNAGGMRCVKYGVTRDFVRSLEVVLADGEVVRTSPETVKAVAGLDLTGLVVGSEGTLAVVTEATLGLLPAPGPDRGVCATFATVADALDAANAVVASAHRPSTLELLDGVVLASLVAYDPDAGLPAGAEAMLLAITDEALGGAEDVAAYEAIARAHGAVTVDVAHDEERLHALMRARRAFNPAMRAVRGGSINEDVAVPRTRLPELLERLGEISAQSGLPIGTGGHVGDGNLHPVIAFDPADPAQVAAAADAHARILGLAVELGGTVTGEHGIGTEKRGALAGELGERVLAIQRGIKAVLDPRGILNPGKKL
ncbi:FAD-linked oxidase C-terminal domain-containing protein [Cellulomonas sp. ES6]|uniref:FAD-binding oxidoreductase n=1 Tax=Cellulomonas sp. ES6 TaxID=3039384 RepID=UPI0024B76CB6|nr:FAD-linked oxidase C-terminal domain-containing protein [Cellulomonas sp. ES6]WHP15953.1 FAD-linked oxidase C-terminal domain-containing protein [Cellulomonas sp. ES6]